jgi:CBS domain-containing protein
MARYRNDFNEDRDVNRERDLRMRREAPWGYDDSAERNRREFIEGNRRTEFSRGRFGERAEYDYDEPRYGDARGSFRDEGFREYSQDRWRGYDPVSYRERRYDQRATGQYTPERSRLRCRDIMTRDLAVATRDTSLREVAVMMKQEDTGVIPVVEYQSGAGNGRAATRDEAANEARTYGRGKLVGLITDRDIVIRAVGEDKDCATTRAEEIMTTDIYTARPNDRVVDVIRKMGEKQVRRIPVTGEDGRLLGMISMADVAVETEADEELADALEHISKGSSFWRQIFG